MRFSDVIGQYALKDHLILEVQSDNLSHARLFLGKAGYGGLPLALSFIQYLFCEKRQDTDSCGECPSCHKVSKLQHPDLHFAFPVVQTLGQKSDLFLNEWRAEIIENPYFDLQDWVRKIDEKERKPIISVFESQEIIKKLSLKSFEGGYKVMIIWMAEEMNTQCANKLLKILEEPPPKTLFILLSEDQERMLPTILSRMQILRIPAVDSEDVRSFLKSRQHMSSSAIDSIAGRAAGNIISAEKLAFNTGEQEDYRELFIQLMRTCYKKDVILMIDWAESVSATTKDRQKLFIEYALHMFRQSMLKNYTGDQLTSVSNEEDGFLNNFSKFITGNNILDFMKTFNEAHYHLERNANPKILFTSLCFKVMRFIHFA